MDLSVRGSAFTSGESFTSRAPMATTKAREGSSTLLSK